MTTTYSTLYKSLIQASLNKSHLNKSALALAASTLACLPAVAAENDLSVQSDVPVAIFPKMTVTATRTPTAVNNTIAQTRIIDSEDLKRYQGQTVLDVIARQPGFSSFSNGGMGTTSNFYMRGYDSKQILVLIDGVRTSSLSTGQPALNLLPADQIDRIEILYGASGSSIYGADAMGGVIQIFTKGSNVDESQFSITAGVGSNDQYLYGATAQFRNDQGTSLSLSASHNKTDGINATLPNPSDPNSPYNRDKDGFESDNYSLYLNHEINSDLKVGISGIYSESTSDFDNGSSTGKDLTKSDQKNGSAQAYADWNYASGSNVKLTYGHSIDESDNPTYSSEYHTKQDQISLVGNQALSIGKVVYGVEHLNQKLDGFLNVYPAPDYIPTKFDYSPDDRKVTSGFLGFLTSYNNVDAQANVRYDDYSDFDSKTTYNLGAAYHFTPEWRAGINYAKGYRVPTFNDLYYPGSENPNLTPETSDNYETFVEYTTPKQSTRITGYYNKVDDFIAWTGSRSENVNEAEIKGVTLTSDWYLDDYLFGFSYDYQDATDESDYTGRKDYDGNSIDYHGNSLPIRPEHKGLVYVGYQLDDLDLRAEYQYVDDYYYNVDNSKAQKVDSYNLVNLSGNYQLNPNLSITTRLNNVFNEKYVTAPGYNTDGINFLTSLTYTWK